MISWTTAALLARLASAAPGSEAILDRAAEIHGWTPQQRAEIDAIFARSSLIGAGYPESSVHPMTEAQCEQRLSERGFSWRDERDEGICGAPFMRPLYDPATERPEDATRCIDTLEFPDLPCAMPVVWVRASEAAALCEAQGKRICDAHEWEGACAGALHPPDYRFDLAAGRAVSDAHRAMRAAHNAHVPLDPPPHTRPCATGSRKTPGCDGSDPRACGSNTYPAGAFPECSSPLGVGDLFGNTAEHMNLPLAPDEMASAGSSLGRTEMKGAWFVWDSTRAHEDACRWRAPAWHGTALRAEDSHRNYHLGFRCCKDLAP